VALLLWPKEFADYPRDPLVWVVRFIGAGLVIWGVTLLRKEQEKKECL